MKGRPKQTRLIPKWVKKRKRWKVVVPASWEGKRVTAFFDSHTGAALWALDREHERAKGLPVSTDRSEVDGEKTIRVLRKMYEDERPPAGLRLIRNHLGKLDSQFGGITLSELSPHAAKKWLAALEYKPRTRWGIYSTCLSFGRWAIRYNFSKANPFLAMEPPDKGSPTKTIFQPTEIVSLLDSAAILKKHKIVVPDYMRAWMVLGAFAGLRTEEIFRMSWEDLKWQDKEVHVPATAIKRTRGGMRERFVSMLPAFLAICPRGLTGKIIPVSKTVFHSHATRLAGAVLGLEEWPHNALRHSFASYHLAMWEDAGKTAHQMGHTSPGMVHQNYARAVRKAAAVEWWGIGVPAARNVTPMVDQGLAVSNR